ncbi:VOC family protein [Methylobacterium sp. 1030]|uniref:bleomycin resistance protein n=1 Tax=Methylobacterium sp. 1030 TaxID=3156404 RepID=UPI003398B04C
MRPLTDSARRTHSSGSGAPPEGGFSALTPELDVEDLETSLRFWCDLLGFKIAYDRPAEGFAYLVRGGAQIMLCQGIGRWMTGALERPRGRGVNFQIMVDRLDPVLTALASAQWPLFEEPRDAWYRTCSVEGGQREFLVQDPDGYLVRLAENLGERQPD